MASIAYSIPFFGTCMRGTTIVGEAFGRAPPFGVQKLPSTAFGMWTMGRIPIPSP